MHSEFTAGSPFYQRHYPPDQELIMCKLLSGKNLQIRHSQGGWQPIEDSNRRTWTSGNRLQYYVWKTLRTLRNICRHLSFSLMFIVTRKMPVTKNLSWVVDSAQDSHASRNPFSTLLCYGGMGRHWWILIYDIRTEGELTIKRADLWVLVALFFLNV